MSRSIRWPLFTITFPDLDNWSQSRRVEPEDVRFGERLVEIFKPFLIDLIQNGKARKTIRRHRDSLWMLGGEIIRHRHIDDDYAAMRALDAVLGCISNVGGPLLFGYGAEEEQPDFDSTCKKLYRFLNQAD